MAATASPGRHWFFVEVAGAWGRNAFSDSPVLDPSLGRMLVARTHEADMRIAAIRRPGRSRGAGRWRWAIVDCEQGQESLRWGEVDDPADLLAVPLDGTSGIASREPVFAVCTHGRHDECCAVRGRVVALRLAEQYPDQTWECSHIGGDRYAATMLLLPHGLNYGRVDQFNAFDIVRAYLDGRIAADGYRGRTVFDRVVQAAQDAARHRFDDFRIDAFPPLSVSRLDTSWRVSLGAEHPVTVEVIEQAQEPMYTTCHASIAVAVPSYTATVVEEVGTDPVVGTAPVVGPLRAVTA